MNTITIGNTTYNEFEVNEALGKANTSDEWKRQYTSAIREVYNFFNNLEWEDGSTGINRDDVNEVLRSIGSDIIRRTYYATVLIEARVTGYSAENDLDAIDCIGEDISIDIGSGDVEVISLDISDVWEED